MSQNNLPDPGSVWQGEDGEVRLVGRVSYSFIDAMPVSAYFAFVDGSNRGPALHWPRKWRMRMNKRPTSGGKGAR